MQTVVERFRKSRLIPVIVIDDPQHAVPLARALEEGGLPAKMHANHGAGDVGARRPGG